MNRPFRKPTWYELIYQFKRYAPKAVIGLACRHFIGRILQPEEFSDGEAPGQADFVLRKLGFTVVKTGDEERETQTGKDWSENEVRLIVADYFEMLKADLLGNTFKKSERRSSRYSDSMPPNFGPMPNAGKFRRIGYRGASDHLLF